VLVSVWVWAALIFLGTAYIAKEVVQWVLILRTLFLKSRTGPEAMVGRTALVKQAFAPGEHGQGATGKVAIHGEIWNAVLEECGDPFPGEGDEVTVSRLQGLTLHVVPTGEGNEG
jgi:membrane protein implicated in regulation of membrane protease activity